MELGTNHKGALAETRIAAEALEQGVEVYRPVIEGGRYDLIFGFRDGRLVRVQCKWAPRHGDTVAVRGTTSVRAPGGGYRRRSYSPTEIDAVAAYCHELRRCYLVPAALICGRRTVSLRLGPCQNNQALGIHWAAQYEFGAIAQLGEHLHGMQGVVGSSPTSSISAVGTG